MLLRAFDAVSLDVGGVLVTPDDGILARELDRRGIPYDRSRFVEARIQRTANGDG